MKKIFQVGCVLLFSMISMQAFSQQDKSKRPSPPTTSQATLSNGTQVQIQYGQPSVKGRTIGDNLEPKAGKVWRTGANEATVIEFSKDVKVEGKALKAGKYALFTIWDGKDGWTVIFSSNTGQWGAYDYKEAEDVLRIQVKGAKGTFSEKLQLNANNSGKVDVNWGDYTFSFSVQ